MVAEELSKAGLADPEGYAPDRGVRVRYANLAETLVDSRGLRSAHRRSQAESRFLTARYNQVSLASKGTLLFKRPVRKLDNTPSHPMVAPRDRQTLPVTRRGQTLPVTHRARSAELR